MKNTKRTVIEVQSDARTGFYDATEAIAAWASGQKGSLLHLFLPHTTAPLVISDKMDTVSRDVDMLLGTIFPEKGSYVHRSPNSDAHAKSVVCGCELTIPLEEGRLLLGEWQRVFVVEGDGPGKTRKIICTITE